MAHPDFANKLFTGYNTNDASSNVEWVLSRHGTWTASVIATATNNSAGVAGIGYNLKVVPIKADSLETAGNFALSDVAEAIEWATDDGARIINMSLGYDMDIGNGYPHDGVTDFSVLYDAIEYAYNEGVLIVASAGNSYANLYGFPASYAHVLAVSSTDTNNDLSVFSSWNNCIDLAAPGTGILVASPPSTYLSVNGTSFSAPAVAAAAGLVLSVNPNLTNDEVQGILETTATDYGDSGYDTKYGHGMLDIYRAVLEAKSRLAQYATTAFYDAKPIRSNSNIMRPPRVYDLAIYDVWISSNIASTAISTTVKQGSTILGYRPGTGKTEINTMLLSNGVTELTFEVVTSNGTITFTEDAEIFNIVVTDPDYSEEVRGSVSWNVDSWPTPENGRPSFTPGSLTKSAFGANYSGISSLPYNQILSTTAQQSGYGSLRLADSGTLKITQTRNIFINNLSLMFSPDLAIEGIVVNSNNASNRPMYTKRWKSAYRPSYARPPVVNLFEVGTPNELEVPITIYASDVNNNVSGYAITSTVTPPSAESFTGSLTS